MKTTLIRISVWTFALSLVPGMALAAKGSDHLITPHKPTVVNPAPALLGPTPSMMINKAPATTRVQPKVKIKPKPSVVKLPDGVRANTGKKLTSPSKLNPVASPGRVVKLPGAAGIKNAPALRNANQVRGLKDAKDAAEAAINVSNMPKGMGGVNLDLGLKGGNLGGNNQAKGLDGKPVDPSKLPGHGAGRLGMPEGTEYLPDLPSNKKKGPASLVGSPSGDFRGIMKGAVSDIVSTIVKPRVDGGSITTTKFRDGSVINVASARNSVGGWNRITLFIRPNGRGTRRIQVLTADFVEVTNTVVDVNTVYYPGGYNNGTGRVTSRPPLNQTQDPNADTNNSTAGQSYDHSAKAQGPIVTYVNPGRNADGGRPATTLVIPEDQLVINPSTEAGNGQALDLSPEARKTRQEQMLEAVNGPSGDGNPGIPDS